MPFDPATMIESVDEQGSGLRVVFFKPALAADRWGHVVASVLNAGEVEETVIPQLVSHEGTGAGDWPLSPPLQSLAIERRAEGAVALLVGMSRQSHWSASFEALADRRLVVDIACRLGTGGEWRLGSRYQAMPTWQAVEVSIGPEIVMSTTSDGFTLEAQATSQRPVRWKYEVRMS